MMSLPMKWTCSVPGSCRKASKSMPFFAQYALKLAR